MNIVIVQNKDTENGLYFTDEHVSQIKAVGSNIQVTVINKEQELLDASLVDADILLYTGNPQALKLEKANNLKWIQITTAGATDMAVYLKNTPILLTNASGVHPIPIAEYVLTLMLMFSRQVYKAYRIQIQEKKWQQSIDLQPFELAGKVVSIVGYGRIGQRVAHLTKGFGMEVLALSHREFATDPNVDTFYPQDRVNELLAASDFVINCLPLTSETEYFFTKEKLDQMKTSAYFINIGRGKTVVEKDLISALQEGKIAGAGLDVFSEEPLPQDSPLWDLDNVILTPHFSGWTPEYGNRVITIFCKNLQAFLRNEPMPTLVNKEQGY